MVAMRAARFVRRCLLPGNQRRRLAEIRRLNSLPRRTPTATNLFGSPFRLVDAASFVAQYRQFFETPAYQVHFSSETPRILDCGANVGVSVLFWKTLAPDSNITAFEADPEIAQLLAGNVDAAGVDSSVSVVAAAVWTESGTVNFASDGADTGHIGGDRRVPAVRLRDYLAEPVDLLKLDIEGAEVAVLRDCADRIRSVEHLVVEYHSFANQTQRLGELVTLLEATDFRVAIMTEYAPDSPFLGPGSGEHMDNRLIVYGIRQRTGEGPGGS